MRETEAQTASNNRLDSSATTRSALVKRWMDAGQSEEPDTVRLTQRRARIKERSAQLEPLRATRQQLVAGDRKWMSDDQLRRVEARIAEIVRNEEAATILMSAG